MSLNNEESKFIKMIAVGVTIVCGLSFTAIATSLYLYNYKTMSEDFITKEMYQVEMHNLKKDIGDLKTVVTEVKQLNNSVLELKITTKNMNDNLKNTLNILNKKIERIQDRR